MIEFAGQPLGLLMLIFSASIDLFALYFLFALHLYVRFCRVFLFLLLHEFFPLTSLLSTGIIKSADAVPKDITRFQ